MEPSCEDSVLTGCPFSYKVVDLRYLVIESMQWVCQIPRYREAFERSVAKHGTNIARIIVARMLLRSLFKMLKDQVRFNQAPAA